MVAKYAFIVAWSDNYLPGITALRNSAKAHSPHIDLIEHRGTGVQDTAIERFRVACDVAKDYDAICLLDADMFLVRPVDLFFDLAAAGFIVTGSNGMVIDYNREYQRRYGLDMGTDHFVYTKLHTTAPIFLNERDIDWFEALYHARRVDSWDDFLYLNLLGAYMGKDRKMLVMPPYVFTGIHHWQLKPATAVIEKGGILMSGTEEEIYMIHGKWWDQAWLQDLMPTMRRYLKDEQIGEKGERRVKRSLELIQAEFARLQREDRIDGS